MTFTIPAEVHSDDHKAKAEFDAVLYFEQADDNDLVELVRCDCSGDYPADEVAQHMADLNEDVGNVFTYLSFGPEQFGEKVGFECSVEQKQALAWIKANRPLVYQRLIDDDLIDQDD
jgi:hypothetical protein